MGHEFPDSTTCRSAAWARPSQQLYSTDIHEASTSAATGSAASRRENAYGHCGDRPTVEDGLVRYDKTLPAQLGRKL